MVVRTRSENSGRPGDATWPSLPPAFVASRVPQTLDDDGPQRGGRGCIAKRLTAPGRPLALSIGQAPNRPTRNRGPPPAPLRHDGALVRSTPTPGSPHRVRPRRQPRGGPMSGVELVAGVPRRRGHGRRPRPLRAPAPRRCVDRPTAPAWAMSVGTTRQTAAGRRLHLGPDRGRCHRASSWALGHGRPASVSSQGHGCSAWVRAGGPRNYVPGRPRRWVRLRREEVRKTGRGERI